MDLNNYFPSFEAGFMLNPFNENSSDDCLNTIEKINFGTPVYDHYDAIKMNNLSEIPIPVKAPTLVQALLL